MPAVEIKQCGYVLFFLMTHFGHIEDLKVRKGIKKDEGKPIRAAFVSSGLKRRDINAIR